MDTATVSVLQREWSMDPQARIRHYTDLYSNACVRVVLPAGRSVLRYDALVLVPDATEEIDEQGQTVEGTEQVEEEEKPQPEDDEAGKPQYDDQPHQPRKYYVRGGKADIDTELTYDLDADGSKLRTVQITQYAAETVKTSPMES